MQLFLMFLVFLATTCQVDTATQLRLHRVRAGAGSGGSFMENFDVSSSNISDTRNEQIKKNEQGHTPDEE